VRNRAPRGRRLARDVDHVRPAAPVDVRQGIP
jgi:hypothetical protein